MPAHHLVGEGAGYIIDVERVIAVTRSDLGVEQHLPQQVAQLLPQVGPCPDLHRIDQFGALLDEVGHERPVIDLLGPHTPVAHRSHRVGSPAQRVR